MSQFICIREEHVREACSPRAKALFRGTPYAKRPAGSSPFPRNVVRLESFYGGGSVSNGKSRVGGAPGSGIQAPPGEGGVTASPAPSAACAT